MLDILLAIKEKYELMWDVENKLSNRIEVIQKISKKNRWKKRRR